MGYQNQLILAMWCVDIFLLLSVSCLPSPCPAKCECDKNGQSAKCINQNLIVLPQGPYSRKLQVMDLSYNRIGILKASMFADQQIFTLANLTMPNNTVSALNNETFRGLAALEYLDLSNNDIQSFSPDIFVDTQRLKTLVLHHNPELELAASGYDLPELTDLILNNCRIKTIPSEFFSKLKYLEYINLSENLIENFDSKLLLSGLENLKRIDLSSNRLYLLQEVVDFLPPSVDILKLSYNPWTCDCEIKKAFAKYENGSYESLPLVCSSPDALKNHTITEELVTTITCTTTTESTTIQATTSEILASEYFQNDQPQAVETVSNNSNADRSEKIVLPSVLNMLSSSGSETKDSDKTGVAGDAPVVTAGGFGNWMIYGAIALVVITSIVVFVVKYQVTKHMQRPGNALATNSADFGMGAAEYQTVNSRSEI